MRITACAIAFVFVATCGTVRADLLAEWTFETSQPALDNSAAIGGITAESGTGTASGLHASALTDWSNPAGNGSVESFSSNEWAANDYYQFSVSTVNFFDVQLSWDQTRSGTGPTTFDLAYSVNGGAFITALDNYTVLNNATATGPPATAPWASGTPRQAVYTFSADLSSVPAVDNASSLVFRLISQVAGSGTAGTNRVDNFRVDATAVPEPAAVLFGVLICGVVGLGAAWKRYFAPSGE